MSILLSANQGICLDLTQRLPFYDPSWQVLRQVVDLHLCLYMAFAAVLHTPVHFALAGIALLPVP